MDFQQNPAMPHTPMKDKRSQSMAVASLILGIVAVFTSGCIYLALICGSLGIILALLSKGGELTLDAYGKAGLILSGIGLALTLLIYTAAFLFVLQQYGGIDGFLEEYLRLYNADTLEELYQSMGVI